ncbi:hypothetical protein KVV02_003755 [Mortierella alpina]|uniref:Uncharacterized protein n=1 Tax=Mortierella alpina TaxID=64518 RepID=A0A9P8A0E9_MORAP|nr:hypothetical protein KVV02_003755 [Mortierella alpina]
MMAGTRSRCNLQSAGSAEHAAELPTSIGSVVLAEFPLTRAEIGSFRQIKTSTRDNDYCICLFEQQQQHQQQSVHMKAQQERGERSITTWLCLPLGGPALGLCEASVKSISYEAATRQLRILTQDSSTSEVFSWWTSYKSGTSSDDPTNGQLARSGMIDLYLSRLVDTSLLLNLLVKMPAYDGSKASPQPSLQQHERSQMSLLVTKSLSDSHEPKKRCIKDEAQSPFAGHFQPQESTLHASRFGDRHAVERQVCSAKSSINHVSHEAEIHTSTPSKDNQQVQHAQEQWQSIQHATETPLQQYQFPRTVQDTEDEEEKDASEDPAFTLGNCPGRRRSSSLPEASKQLIDLRQMHISEEQQAECVSPEQGPRRLSCDGLLESLPEAECAVPYCQDKDESLSKHQEKDRIKGHRPLRASLTISTNFPKDSLQETAMSSVSDMASDRRGSISSSVSDVSISLSHSILSSSSSRSSLCSVPRNGGPPVHYTLMCWIGGRWPCKLRPSIKKSTLVDIHTTLRRNLRLPKNYHIDIEFDWMGCTYMILDATHWQWAREQVSHGDMNIRCRVWQKKFSY